MRFKIGDEVIVVRVDDNEYQKWVGSQGCISEISTKLPYPYTVLVGNNREVFSEAELDFNKNYIVTQILNDL